MQRGNEGVPSKPRIKPAEAGDTRPVSVSARLGRLQFHHSGKFRVLQVSDIQDGPKIAPDTISLIAASLDTVRPDLVVFTGNQTAGYDTAFADTFVKRRWQSSGNTDRAALERTRETVRNAVGQFLAPLIERGVPFAVTFGNHDFQCGLDNGELEAIYRSFPGCLNPAPVPTSDSAGNAGSAANGIGVNASPTCLDEQIAYACEPGTFALPVTDAEQSRTVLGLVILDSGDYAPGGGFGVPSTRAMSFLAAVPAMLDGARSLVFQHMPLPEYYGLLKPVSANTAYAMQGYRTHADTYYVLDEAKVQPGGYLGEGISGPDASGEFAVLRGAGCATSDTADGTAEPPFIGVTAGHDHRNGFVGMLDGVTMMATPTCGFGSYGPAPDRRATRLIEFDIRHPYKPRTQLLEFGELVGKPSSRKAYTYALNAKPPQDGEGDDLLRRPSWWRRLWRSIVGSRTAAV